MREIEFRGKSVKTSEWVFGYFASYRKKSLSVVNVIIDENGKETNVFSETVGQFTDELDVNKKKIFENDLVKFKKLDNIFLVKYDKCTFKMFHTKFFKVDGTPHCWGNLSRCFDPDFLDDEIEVIGNIHDNPELLEVKNY